MSSQSSWSDSGRLSKAFPLSSRSTLCKALSSSNPAAQGLCCTNNIAILYRCILFSIYCIILFEVAAYSREGGGALIRAWALIRGGAYKSVGALIRGNTVYLGRRKYVYCARGFSSTPARGKARPTTPRYVLDGTCEVQRMNLAFEQAWLRVVCMHV